MKLKHIKTLKTLVLIGIIAAIPMGILQVSIIYKMGFEQQDVLLMTIGVFIIIECIYIPLYIYLRKKEKKLSK